jgi:hypothetical protein
MDVDASVEAQGNLEGGGFDATRHWVDAGGDVSTGTCSPASVTDFTPTYNLPVGPRAGACSDEQIQAAVNDCFAPPDGGATGGASVCQSWVTDTKNAGCLSCWAGSLTDMTWAPILESGGLEIIFNVGGCIALADPAELLCARAVEYEVECEIAACLAACPISASGDPTAQLDCIVQADMGGCATFTANAAKCTKELAASKSPANYCLHIDPHGKNALEFARNLVRYMTLACGAAPASDAGPKAPDAESSDAPHE